MDRLNEVLQARHAVAQVRDDCVVRGDCPDALRHALDAGAALTKLVQAIDPRYMESIDDPGQTAGLRLVRPEEGGRDDADER